MNQVRPQAVSPPRRNRRWLRFSVRTLLALTTLFAVWLGVMTHRAREQAKAVQAIQRLSGTVVYDYQVDLDGNYQADAHPPGPRWLRRLIGPDFGTTVTTVELSPLRKGNATDKDLEILRSLPDLQSLWLGHSAAITDEGLRNIAGLSHLELLDLGDTSVTDAGLIQLGNLKQLSSLYLNRCRIDGTGLKHLQHLPIQHLNLNWTGLTDANLKHLAAMNQLEELMMQSTQITDQGLAHLRGLTNLRSLHMQDTLVSDDGLTHLEDLTRLNSLEVKRTKVTKDGLERLKQVLPALPRSVAPRPQQSTPAEH